MSITIAKDKNELLAEIILSPLALYGYKRYEPVIQSRGFKIISSPVINKFEKYNLGYKKGNEILNFGIITFYSSNTKSILESAFSDYNFILTKINPPLSNWDEIKLNADEAFKNAAETWKKGLEKIKQVPELVKDKLEYASKHWGEIEKEHPKFIRNGKILLSCLLDILPYIGNMKACFELVTNKDSITKEELDDIDKILSYISIVIPPFKKIGKSLKISLPKAAKYFKKSDDYATFIKGIWDMYDEDEK